jgi:predicted DNA-binding transcriptional regulator YafY
MNKAERLNQELIYLSNKHTFHLKDIMEEFNISKRTALRDIAELESMGVGLYVESGRYGGYKIINQNLLTPIYFNKNEILAIFFALNALKLLSSTPFKKSYKQIRDKLYSTIPNNLKIDVQNTLNVIQYYNAYPINQSNILADILSSILNQNTITITYTQFTYKELEVQAYELLYRNGIWFFEAYNITEQKWGVFRCDYIQQMVINNEQEVLLSREKLEELKFMDEQAYQNIFFKCELNCAGVETFMKNHYPNMELKYENDTPFIIGKYSDDELNYMTHYLLTLGENVKIIYPQQLKENYLKQLHAMIERYN